MKTILKLLSFFIILFFFYSCASVGVTKSKSYPAKAADCNLDIYFSESEIKKPFEVIALIDSKTGSNAFAKKTVSAAIDLAKPKACECGADAILVVQMDKEGVTAGGYGFGKAMIKCLKYLNNK